MSVVCHRERKKAEKAAARQRQIEEEQQRQQEEAAKRCVCSRVSGMHAPDILVQPQLLTWCSAVPIVAVEDAVEKGGKQTRLGLGGVRGLCKEVSAVRATPAVGTCLSQRTWVAQPPCRHIILPHCCISVCIVPCPVLHRAAEEEAAKAAAAEAKKAREAEKKVIKKQRQLLRGIAEGQGQQRLMSEGEKLGSWDAAQALCTH